MYSFSYLEPVCCSMSSSNCCFLTCIQDFSRGRSGGLVFQSLTRKLSVLPKYLGGSELYNKKSHIYHEKTIIGKKTCILSVHCSNLDVYQQINGLKKKWYIYTMEYYLAIIRNTFESVLMTWMKT